LGFYDQIFKLILGHSADHTTLGKKLWRDLKTETDNEEHKEIYKKKYNQVKSIDDHRLKNPIIKIFEKVIGEILTNFLFDVQEMGYALQDLIAQGENYCTYRNRFFIAIVVVVISFWLK
jgi:hypothetical protein